MSAVALVLADYKGLQLKFTDEGWFDATTIAEKHGRRVGDFLDLASTKEYLEALDQMHLANTGKAGIWKEARRGRAGGTWLHPKLAVRFAQWLDVNFAVWCDEQIDSILRGKLDQRKLRHEAASSYKVMSQVLKIYREEQGKESAPHHFINEALLVNQALSGQRTSLDREAMTSAELSQLAHLEERNAVLIARGVDYQARKLLLQQHAIDWRASHMPRIAAPAANEGLYGAGPKPARPRRK